MGTGIRNFMKQRRIRIVLLGLSLGVILYFVVGPRIPGEQEPQVMISQDDLSHIVVMWEKTWQRPPTDAELEGALDRYVLDEMLYQEALRNDLDKENAMVRQSLINQMNFFAEGQAVANEISDEKARAYYELRKNQFVTPATLSFSQLFFNDSGAVTSKRIAQALELLREDASNIDRLGDRTMLPGDINAYTTDQLLNLFDPSFVDTLQTLTPGQWYGPLNSTYGLHLVFVHENSKGRIKSYEEVKNDIIRELEFQEKEAAREQFYNEIRSRYKVIYRADVSTRNEK